METKSLDFLEQKAELAWKRKAGLNRSIICLKGRYFSDSDQYEKCGAMSRETEKQ